MRSRISECPRAFAGSALSECHFLPCIVDTLTSVDIQEIVKIVGKVQIYEGVIYREKSKVSPLKKLYDKFFDIRQKYKDEHNDVMQLLVKLIMNSLYGERIRKDIEESYSCKSEACMMSEYDERVLDYQKINYRNIIVKMKDDVGLQAEVKVVNTMPLHLGAFILSNGKIIMNFFYTQLMVFTQMFFYYTDTDSLYVEIKHWEKLDKVGLVGKNRLQRKNDNELWGICYGLFLATKILFNYK